MDQITVDVTDVPESCLAGAGRIGSLECGPEVELMSGTRTAPNFWATMAAAAGSITHEQLCRVGARVERMYRYPVSPSSLVAGRIDKPREAVAQPEKPLVAVAAG
jgi:hypothetical protein